MPEYEKSAMQRLSQTSDNMELWWDSSPLIFDTWKKEMLEKAALLVLIAPSQPFTKNEIKWIRDFVKQGGTLILTVGWEERIHVHARYRCRAYYFSG